MVDLTLLMSVHQGMDSSGKHRSEMTKDNFLWNFQFYNSTDISSGFLTSNYFVVCYYLLYSHTQITEIDPNIF